MVPTVSAPATSMAVPETLQAFSLNAPQAALFLGIHVFLLFFFSFSQI